MILDPFMGSGSTVAAAAACGLESIGLEIDAEYWELASKAIPALAAYVPVEVKRNGALAISITRSLCRLAWT